MTPEPPSLSPCERCPQILELVRVYFDSENEPQEARNDAENALKAMLRA